MNAAVRLQSSIVMLEVSWHGRSKVKHDATCRGGFAFLVLQLNPCSCPAGGRAKSAQFVLSHRGHELQGLECATGFKPLGKARGCAPKWRAAHAGHFRGAFVPLCESRIRGKVPAAQPVPMVQLWRRQALVAA